MSAVRHVIRAWVAWVRTAFQVFAYLGYVLWMVPFCIGLNLCEAAYDAMRDHRSRQERI